MYANYTNEIAQLKTAFKAAVARNSEAGRKEALAVVVKESIRLEGVIRGSEEYAEAKAVVNAADRQVRDLPTKGALEAMEVTSFECEEGTAKRSVEEYTDWLAFIEQYPQEFRELIPILFANNPKLNEAGVTDPVQKARIESCHRTKAGSLLYRH